MSSAQIWTAAADRECAGKLLSPDLILLSSSNSFFSCFILMRSVSLVDRAKMWCVVVSFLLLIGTSSANNVEDDLAKAPALVQQFYQTIESAINHLVVSRDMHRAVRRHKRQLSDLFDGGDFIGGLTSLAGLGSLNGLTNAANVLGDGPVPTVM